MGRLYRAFSLLLAVLFVAACSGSAPTPEPTVAAPAFNVAAVRSSFAEECEDPIMVDDLFCTQVEVAAMYAEDDILYVPTGLNAAARDRAQVLCDQIAVMHFDGDGVDLGYRFIGVLDKDGGNAAACSVR